MNDLKLHLIDYIQEITKLSKNGGKNQYICPLCNSGAGKNHSGAFTYYPDTNSYHCFACGASGDIYTLYGLMHGISTKDNGNFKEIAKALATKYNISGSPVPQVTQATNTKADKDYTKFFYVAKKQLCQTDYLTRRGISPEIQQKYNCGYIPNYMYKGNQTTPAIIIPTSKQSYMWRSTTENIKQKRGTAHILNPSALNNQYCFVVEGEIDCMSVDECGFACIGLGSTSNIRKIFDYDIVAVLVIALDNDKAGKKATADLIQLCIDHKKPYITVKNDMWGDCKDANDLLIKDRQLLVNNLKEQATKAINLDRTQWLQDTDTVTETAETEPNKNKKTPLDNYFTFAGHITSQNYVIKYNQITHDFDFANFDALDSRDHLAEILPQILVDELRQKYTCVSLPAVQNYIIRHATRNRYNPILDLIKATKWDGVDRVNQIYDIFKIPADTEDGIFYRMCWLKWLKQSICGLYNSMDRPYSLDLVLTLCGGQGVGKTRFFEKLALDPKYFGEGICLDPRDKDSIKQATSKWICELGEIGSTMRKDMDSVKAFLTKSTDEYRLPYGRASLHYPRMTSFVGTVNDEQFLIDQTGNRRFLVIRLAPDLVIDYETQIKPFNALQLWAQIYELVKNEDKASCFRLSEDEKRYLEKSNSAFVKPMRGECEVLDILEEQQRPEPQYICTTKDMTVTEFITLHNLKYDARTVGQVLKKYGYESRQKKVNGKPVRIINLPYKYYDKYKKL